MARSRVALMAANLLVLALAVATLAAGSPTDIGDIAPQLLDEPLAAPADWFDGQRAVGADRDAYARAIAAAAEADEVGGEWTLLGPRNIGGRVTDLVVDPTTPDQIFIAAASGGVWKSSDAGLTFDRAWPDDITQATGAMAVTPDGTLFVGTGETSPGGGSLVYGGTGIYRSADGGQTWEHLGLETSGAFGRIAVHPTNPDVIYAAASGNLFVPGGERGLYRSTDGGDTWERILEGANATTGAADLSIDPANPDNILVTMWDHHRTPDARIYAGEGSGLYRSTDGGETWTRAPEVTMEEPGDTGRIGVAFSPADPSRAYAVIANRLNGTYGGFFRSDDGGATWQAVSATGSIAGSQSSFGWWFGRVFPDPDEPDRLFVPGVSLTVSTNAGSSFTTSGLGVVHADQHAMAWDPRHDERVYLGNDGGVYRSERDGDEGTWIPGQVQGWTQHYSVDVGEMSGSYVVSGMQDNGCHRTFSPDNGMVSSMTWTPVNALCGDGLATLIKPTDETITYACSQYGGCGRQRLGAPDLTFRNPAGRKGWFAPIEFAPTDPDVMYYGTEQVHRSTNGGTSWTDITGFDMSGVEDQTDPHNGYKIRGVVTAIGIGSTGHTGTVYAGTDNGRLWVTRDLGANWTEIVDETLPQGAWITRVTVDPADAATAYVSYSGYRGGDDTPHVFTTTDAGQTWTDITGNLPPAPVNDVVLAQDGVLVAATDVGVFLRNEAGDWLRVGTNLPTVPVLDLRWHAGTGTLTAATFGHGIQRIELSP
jgi:photosystem II stability/assembly factor-like uncharacterized protein